MTTPITQIPKPEAGQFKDGRKLFLVPSVPMPPQPPEDGQELLERFWSEVRDQVEGLERSLGRVTHVFHEASARGRRGGNRLAAAGQPPKAAHSSRRCATRTRGWSLPRTWTRLEQVSDWQRCLSIGLLSNVVRSTALEGFRDATSRRYEHIAARVDEAIGEGEAGVLFIHEDHGVQVPGGPPDLLRGPAGARPAVSAGSKTGCALPFQRPQPRKNRSLWTTPRTRATSARRRPPAAARRAATESGRRARPGRSRAPSRTRDTRGHTPAAAGSLAPGVPPRPR